MQIRRATENDAEALLKIYAPYVEHTAITFEFEVPSVEEFRSRIRHTLEKYPYLVAQKEKHVIFPFRFYDNVSFRGLCLVDQKL